MNAAPKPSIFIGSSSEQLQFAKAIQENLHHEFEVTVWDQHVFAPSSYPLESLAQQLDQCDFGIFVLAPDDLITLRGHNYMVPRDNVLFELGMFTGKLGRKRAFMVVPQQQKDLHLPTDLLGLTPVTYDPHRQDRNHVAALGPACNRIRDQILNLGLSGARRTYGLVTAALFPDFTGRFDSLLDTACDITLFFIHSRRWRENHNDRIKAFLARPRTRLQVFLPDLANNNLMATMQGHFDDGPAIPGFVADAYRYFISLHQEHKGKVAIRLFQIYPSYSFYLFDRQTAIVAMYPTTTLRKSVPAFEVSMDSEYGAFLSSDMKELQNESREVNIAQLINLAEPYAAKPSSSDAKADSSPSRTAQGKKRGR